MDFSAPIPGENNCPGHFEQPPAISRKSKPAPWRNSADVQKHIEHIKEIVAMQQSFAKVSGVKEILSALHRWKTRSK